MSSIFASNPTPITPSRTALPVADRRGDRKVKYFAQSMPDSEGKPLRVFVQGGGCSGFQYGFHSTRKQRDDNVLEQGGITIVVDPQSAMYLKDSKVDYVEDFRGAGFSVTNPNATGGSAAAGSLFTRKPRRP